MFFLYIWACCWIPPAKAARFSTQEKNLKITTSKKPKSPTYHRDINAQNEWLWANIFDSMGNYMFCHACIKKTLKVSSQQLTWQQNVKRKVVQQAVKQIYRKRRYVDEQKLTGFVIMLNGIDMAFKKWWSSLLYDHTVNFRFPYSQHGLCSWTSNSAKVEAKEAFLQFVWQLTTKWKKNGLTKSNTLPFASV